MSEETSGHSQYEHDLRVELRAAKIEIERLKEESAHFAWRDKDKNELISALYDALVNPVTVSDGPKEARAKYNRNQSLIKRIRELIK